jgi:hypothetical protein
MDFWPGGKYERPRELAPEARPQSKRPIGGHAGRRSRSIVPWGAGTAVA